MKFNTIKHPAGLQNHNLLHTFCISPLSDFTRFLVHAWKAHFSQANKFTSRSDMPDRSVGGTDPPLLPAHLLQQQRVTSSTPFRSLIDDANLPALQVFLVSSYLPS